MLNHRVKKYLDENVFAGIVKSKEAMFHGVIIGIIVGVFIVLTDFLVNDLIFPIIKNLDSNFFYFLPIIGFLLIGIIVKINNLHSSSMADEIVQVYHHGDSIINAKYVFTKMFAFIITISAGLTVGMEGACKWIGGIVGVFYYRIISKISFFKKIRPDLILCMMSGASAGIGAIFKAPLSGTVMALESPFKKDFAHKPLIQSFISAVTSYTVYTTFRGDSKFFLISISYKLKLEDIFYSVLLGFICGIFSNLLIKLNSIVRDSFSVKRFMKYLIGGIMLSLLSFIYLNLEKRQDILFSGIEVIKNIFNESYTIDVLIVLLIFRFLAYIVTFSFGGIGGQFLPIATLGACLGFLIQVLLKLNLPQVFPLIGIASFITASYNGLLFGPVLIAEITGEPNMVVLGIAASSVSFLATNGVSNSRYQKQNRDEIV